MAGEDDEDDDDEDDDDETPDRVPVHKLRTPADLLGPLRCQQVEEGPYLLPSSTAPWATAPWLLPLGYCPLHP